MTLIFTVNTQARETNKKTLVSDSLLSKCIELDCLMSIVDTVESSLWRLANSFTSKKDTADPPKCIILLYPRSLRLYLENQFKLVY